MIVTAGRLVSMGPQEDHENATWLTGFLNVGHG